MLGYLCAVLLVVSLPACWAVQSETIPLVAVPASMAAVVDLHSPSGPPLLRGVVVTNRTTTDTAPLGVDTTLHFPNRMFLGADMLTDNYKSDVRGNQIRCVHTRTQLGICPFSETRSIDMQLVSVFGSPPFGVNVSARRVYEPILVEDVARSGSVFCTGFNYYAFRVTSEMQNIIINVEQTTSCPSNSDGEVCPMGMLYVSQPTNGCPTASAFDVRQTFQKEATLSLSKSADLENGVYIIAVAADAFSASLETDLGARNSKNFVPLKTLSCCTGDLHYTIKVTSTSMNSGVEYVLSLLFVCAVMLFVGVFVGVPVVLYGRKLRRDEHKFLSRTIRDWHESKAPKQFPVSASLDVTVKIDNWGVAHVSTLYGMSKHVQRSANRMGFNRFIRQLTEAIEVDIAQIRPVRFHNTRTDSIYAWVDVMLGGCCFRNVNRNEGILSLRIVKRSDDHLDPPLIARKIQSLVLDTKLRESSLPLWQLDPDYFIVSVAGDIGELFLSEDGMRWYLTYLLSTFNQDSDNACSRFVKPTLGLPTTKAITRMRSISRATDELQKMTGLPLDPQLMELHEEDFSMMLEMKALRGHTLRSQGSLHSHDAGLGARASARDKRMPTQAWEDDGKSNGSGNGNDDEEKTNILQATTSTASMQSVASKSELQQRVAEMDIERLELSLVHVMQELRSHGYFTADARAAQINKYGPKNETVVWYWRCVVIAALFSITVALIFTLHSTDSPTCVYNERCRRDLTVLSWIRINAFNQVLISNFAYVLAGLWLVHYWVGRYPDGIDNRFFHSLNVKEHKYIVQSMGAAMIAGGFSSMVYHSCPTVVAYQLDTMFSTMVLFLAYVALWNRRHTGLMSFQPFPFFMLYCLVVVLGFIGLYAEMVASTTFFWVGFAPLWLVVSYVQSHQYLADIIRPAYGFAEKTHHLSPYRLLRLYQLVKMDYLNLYSKGVTTNMRIRGLLMLGTSLFVNWALLASAWDVEMDVPTFFFAVGVLNLAGYLGYYFGAKVLNGEPIKSYVKIMCAVEFIIALASLYIFKGPGFEVAAKELGQDRSRQLNQGCFLLGLDYHDLWHIGSSLFVTGAALIIHHIDDGIDATGLALLRVF